MKVICWDIDDVLNNLMSEWLVYYNKINDSNIKFFDLHENPPSKILDIPINRYLISLDEFRIQDYLKLTPVKEIFDWFLEKGVKHKHIALTAVPLNCAHLSADWVIMNFGQWIRSFSFIPSKRDGQVVLEYATTKAEFIKDLGDVDLFIDDSEHNIDHAKKQGINTILFPRPWNSNRDKNIRWLLSELDKNLE